MGKCKARSMRKVLVAMATLLFSVTAQAETYYFHNDQLGTPQSVTDATQQVVWKGEYDPFGKVTETVALVEQNIRFPGQYFDEESGLHYNYFRTYDPSIGRYVESDPIGLLGGLSSYGYAYQNPITFIDPHGLDAFTLNASINIPFVGGLELGIVEFFGAGVPRRDVGVFVTFKKPIGGHGNGLKAKLAVGTAATLGCRANFDGIGNEQAIGYGVIGGSVGLENSSTITSTSFSLGPQAGYQSAITQTFSLTIRDVGRSVRGFGRTVLAVFRDN